MKRMRIGVICGDTVGGLNSTGFVNGFDWWIVDNIGFENVVFYIPKSKAENDTHIYHQITHIDDAKHKKFDLIVFSDGFEKFSHSDLNKIMKRLVIR